MQLIGTAPNPWSLRRQLALLRRIDRWSPDSLQQRLVKAGGRLLERTRYDDPPLAERHLTRRPVGTWRRRIELLLLSAG